MKIVVDRPYIQIDGILTSMIDTYYNLKKFGFDVELVISSTDIGKDILNIPTNFNDRSLLKCLTNDITIEDDIIITSSYTVAMNRLFLSTDKLIMMDSFHSFFFKDLQADVYLTNPVNKRPDTLLYYHKFNIDRLNMFSWTCNYFYNRTKKKNSLMNGIYFENIGKSIFEHLYHDNRVFYSPMGLTVKDGLCYYLELFGIDGFKEQEIKIDKEEIVDKLVMKEDDVLIKCIS